MNASNFANPLEAVQIISIVSYLNILSDFLYAEKLLEENDLYKKIPIVNGLYAYFAKNEANPDENMLLIRKLLEGSDLYGEKENETVDMKFVNTMFNYIISFFVFEEYGNIYGFLAEIVRTSENVTIDFLLQDIRIILKNLTFNNEIGDYSTLSPLSVECIFKDLVEPLFPLPKEGLSIVSVDYTYAQAGLMFLRSSQLNSRYFPQTNISHMNFTDPDTLFDEYIAVGHILQNLVDTNKLGDLAMSFFSLPVLLRYVYKEKTNLPPVNIKKIIEDPNQWAKAYQHSLGYFYLTFTDLAKVRDTDYRYQLHLALANFQNRTMLAREMIKSICSIANEDQVEKKVVEYVNHVTDYRCENERTWVILPDLNQLYEKEISKVIEIYFRYEQESIREAFGQSLIESVNKGHVIIFRGSFVNEMIRPSDDLLEFYYPDFHQLFHYALIRKDHNVILIRESDNPVLFFEELGVSISERFTEQDWKHPLKSMVEDFDQFLFNLASERTQKFEAHFFSFEFGHKTSNWWKDFGLSLIPFYSCITSSIKGNTFDAFISCPMDTMLLFSVAGAVENVVMKITTAATRGLFSKSGTTIRAISLKDSIRNLINIGSNSVENKMVDLRKAIENKMYQDLGHALVRLKDLGMELDFIIDSEGLSAIEEWITKVEDVARLQFISVIPMLERTKKMVTSLPMAISQEFKKHPVYVKSIDKGKNTGYGYKFVYLPNNEIAEIRHIHESKNEVLVVYDRVNVENGRKIYKEVEEETMKIKEYDLHVEDDGLLVGNPEGTPNIIRLLIYNEGQCLTSKKKRNLEDNIYCPRTPDLIDSFVDLELAKDYALRLGINTENEIRYILKCFYFPPGSKTGIDFVEDWTKGNDFLPDWSRKFKIQEPLLFYDLRFKKLIGSKSISREEAIERIESLYSASDLERIIVAPQYMRIKYLEQKAYYSVKFEDYFAIGNQQGLFDSGGYLRLRENTDEARRMRNALYRLAIRQHFDPIEEFPQKLFRGEKRPQNVIDKLFVPGKDFSFGRFTSTSSNEETALAFANKGRSKDPKVFYEINFSGRYLRARVEKVYFTRQAESVLLPQAKFRIEEVTRETIDTIGDHFRVVLSEKKEIPSNDLKNVLRQIKCLKDSGTQFYFDELPKSSLANIQLCRNSLTSLACSKNS